MPQLDKLIEACGVATEDVVAAIRYTGNRSLLKLLTGDASQPDVSTEVHDGRVFERTRMRTADQLAAFGNVSLTPIDNLEDLFAQTGLGTADE
jgi:hypothetical protein